MAQPNIYLYNPSTGKTWNLRPRLSEMNGLFIAMEGSGFETKNSYTRVDNDFVLTEEDPQQVKITGTMYFRTADAIDAFGDFCGNFDGEMKLYYDRDGQYDDSQLEKIWYKTVRLTKFENAERDTKTDTYKVKVEFTPDSAMWKKDMSENSNTSTSVTGEAGEMHLFEPLKFVNGVLQNADGTALKDLDAEAYFYDLVHRTDNDIDGVFYYTSGQDMVAVINNTGSKTPARIIITNSPENTSNITWIEWTCVAEDGTVQYAAFTDLNIAPGGTFVIDSGALTQCATYTRGDVEEDYAGRQDPRPSYINFIQLYSGTNTITFTSNLIEGVTVTIEYTEQVRAI